MTGNRIDLERTEADFIEFRFASNEAAEAAEKHFPTDFVSSGGTVLEYRAGHAVEGIRQRLEAAGLEWDERESGLTEEDMWPDWPGDEGDDEDETFRP